MKEFISILILLFFPIMYKMVKDWRGVKHPATGEVFNVGLIMIVDSLITISLIGHGHFYVELLKCLAVSVFGYQLFFPYIFNWFWWKRFHEYSSNPEIAFSSRIKYTLVHLSDSAVPDKWPAYRALGWAGRMILWLVLFSLSIYWFCL